MTEEDDLFNVILHTGSIFTHAAAFSKHELIITNSFPTQIRYSSFAVLPFIPNSFRVGYDHFRTATRSFTPVSQGTVTDIDMMDKIYYHTMYNEIRLAPEESNMVLTRWYFEDQQNLKTIVRKLCEAHQPTRVTVIPVELLLALSSYEMDMVEVSTENPTPTKTPASHQSPFDIKSLTTLIVDFGYQQIRIVPVIQGVIHTYAARVLDYGSQQVAQRLVELTAKSGALKSLHYSDRDAVRQIARDNAYVLVEQHGGKRPTGIPESKLVEINSEPIKLTSELHACTEVLFQSAPPLKASNPFVLEVNPNLKCDLQHVKPIPSFSNCNYSFSESYGYMEPAYKHKEQRCIVEDSSLQEAIAKVLRLSPPYVRNKLASSIVLTGGFAKTKGLSERLLSELKRLVPNETIVIRQPLDTSTHEVISGFKSLYSTRNGQLLSEFDSCMVDIIKLEKGLDIIDSMSWSQFYQETDQIHFFSNVTKLSFTDCQIYF